MQDDIINIIKELSDKVNAIYMEKERQSTHQKQTVELQDLTYDDPNSRIRASLVEVEGYTELLRAIQSMAKNMESTLVGYQILLAQITRPLDQYFHNQLRRGRVLNESDEDIEIINITRIMISDLASKITQNRMENFHKTMDLPGKEPHLSEPSNKPLIDEEKLETLIAARKPAERRKGTFKTPFCQRQQQAFREASATAPKRQATSNNTGHTKNANQVERKESRKFHQRSKNQSSHLGKAYKTGVDKSNHWSGIQDTVQEIRTSPTYGKSSPPQDKDEKRCSQYYYKRGKLNFSKENDRASKRPIQCVLQSSIHYYQENRISTVCFRIKNAEQVCGRPLVQNGNDEDNMSHVAQKGLYDIDEIEGTQGKDQGPSRKRGKANKGSKLFIEEYGKLHWQSTSNLDSYLSWKIDVKKTSGTEEKGFIEIQFMDIDSEARQSIHTQTYVVARSPFEIHHPHQLQRVMENIICFETTANTWMLNKGLHEQSVSAGVNQEVWWNCLEGSPRNIREIMEILLSKKYETDSCVCPDIHQPSRCTESHDGPNRVVAGLSKVQGNKHKIWSTRRGPICLGKKQKGNNKKNKERKPNFDADNPSFELCSMVPGRSELYSSASNENRSNRGYTRPEKRKITFERQQGMASDSMENQWCPV
ncbi:hypothetical protein AYI68_g4884 [Smittium mucronatum]|uniref:Uncharacterized protein n=1 Tax=Smittium mucronatum TaxID=133383 RepID=A0A1R0GVT5_9FUNG|nr:hypothetical protein AYI68_g4884 [Smittium mucronatum]